MVVTVGRLVNMSCTEPQLAARSPNREEVERASSTHWGETFLSRAKQESTPFILETKLENIIEDQRFYLVGGRGHLYVYVTLTCCRGSNL